MRTWIDPNFQLTNSTDRAWPFLSQKSRALLVARRLVEAQPFDPLASSAVALAFAAVGGAAAVVPARRAMGLDSLTALRSD